MLKEPTPATSFEVRRSPQADLRCSMASVRAKNAEKLRDSHLVHGGNIKVVRTQPAPNFTVSFKIFKSLCDLRDLCVSQWAPALTPLTSHFSLPPPLSGSATRPTSSF
jgi:hypothetical protein